MTRKFLTESFLRLNYASKTLKLVEQFGKLHWLLFPAQLHLLLTDFHRTWTFKAVVGEPPRPPHEKSALKKIWRRECERARAVSSGGDVANLALVAFGADGVRIGPTGPKLLLRINESVVNILAVSDWTLFVCVILLQLIVLLRRGR